MGKALLEAARPPMWHIEDAGKAGEAAYVRFGAHRVRLADVTGLKIEEVRSYNIKGLATMAVFCLVVAGLLSYLVVERGAMSRFLLGSVFFGMLACAGILELFRIRRLSHFELTVVLSNGEQVLFASPDRADVQALALSIAAGQANAAR